MIVAETPLQGNVQGLQECSVQLASLPRGYTRSYRDQVVTSTWRVKEELYLQERRATGRDACLLRNRALAEHGGERAPGDPLQLSTQPWSPWRGLSAPFAASVCGNGGVRCSISVTRSLDDSLAKTSTQTTSSSSVSAFSLHSGLVTATSRT